MLPGTLEKKADPKVCVYCKSPTDLDEDPEHLGDFICATCQRKYGRERSFNNERMAMQMRHRAQQHQWQQSGHQQWLKKHPHHQMQYINPQAMRIQNQQRRQQHAKFTFNPVAPTFVPKQITTNLIYFPDGSNNPGLTSMDPNYPRPVVAVSNPDINNAMPTHPPAVHAIKESYFTYRWWESHLQVPNFRRNLWLPELWLSGIEDDKIIQIILDYSALFPKLELWFELLKKLNFSHNDKNIDLSRRKMTDDNLSAIGFWLKTNNTMLSLNLAGNSLAHAGHPLAEGLKDNTRLKSLNLGRNCITIAGSHALVEALKINRTLTTLIVNGEIPISIFRDKKTQDLNLSYKGYSDADAIVIASLIQKNTTLLTLDLSLNSIAEEGAIAIAAALEENMTLQKLILHGIIPIKKFRIAEKDTINLSYRGYNDADAIVIASLLKRTRILRLRITNKRGIGIRKHPIYPGIRVGCKLVYNEIYEYTEKKKYAWHTLGVFTTTMSLNFYRLADDRGWIHNWCKQEKTRAGIAELHIRVLNLASNNIGDTGARYLVEGLKSNTTLRSLNLRDNRIGDDTVRGLANLLQTNSSLKELNLESNNIGDDGASCFILCLNKNKTLKLNIRWNMKMSSKITVELRKFEGVKCS